MDDPQKDLLRQDAEAAKMRRIALSVGDLADARAFLELRKSSDQEVIKAAECAFIIAYSRPFSGNTRSAPDLPSGSMQDFSESERLLHGQVVKHRDMAIAHSEAETAQVQFAVREIDGKKLVSTPLVIKYFPFLSYEDIPVLSSCIDKLMAYCQKERERIATVLPIGAYAWQT